MTFAKQEEKINKLYNRVKEINLSQDEIAEINITGLLYSCSRLNQLQVIAILTKIALSHELTINDIRDLLS